MKTLQTSLLVVIFVFGLNLITGCNRRQSPTFPEETATYAGEQTLQKSGDDVTVITVSSGDVAALYAAVYDDNGMPRDKVVINLEPGVFQLDPSQSFEGRLVLGEKTVLRSNFKMALDANGVPLVENDEPVVLEAGAKIDGSGLTPARFGEGIIMVGDKGLVEKIWLDGGVRPGVVITSQGTVREVASTSHSIGFQVRATGQKAYAILERNLAAGNSLGISTLTLDPLLGHPTGANVKVQAEIRHNASVNNSNVNLAAFGGVGSTNNNELRVNALHNVLRKGASLGNIRIVGGQNILAPGSNNNKVEVSLIGNLIADAAIGLKVEGGNLTPFGPSSLEERQSSNNQLKVKISKYTFENNDLDIRVEGSRSDTNEPGGDNNEAEVVVQDGNPTVLTIETFNCFPEENWTGSSTECTSEAKVEFDDDNLRR